MENKDLFHSFNYVVGNDFIYQDKVVVKVFYLYKNTNVIKNVDIKKKNNAPESYYKDEAKKIIDQLIKSGELEKYSKLYLKKDKRKKGLAVLIPFVCACALAGAGVGTYYYVTSHQVVKEEVVVDVPEINGLIVNNQKAYVGEDYDTSISVNTTLTTSVLPDELVKVVSGNRELRKDEYTYTVSEDKLSATLHIPGKYIEGDVKIELVLVEPTPPVPPEPVIGDLLTIEYEYHNQNEGEDIVGFKFFDKNPNTITFDWGDGKVEKVTAYTDFNEAFENPIKHKYESAPTSGDTYTINISGELSVLWANDAFSGLTVIENGDFYFKNATLHKNFNKTYVEKISMTMSSCALGGRSTKDTSYSILNQINFDEQVTEIPFGLAGRSHLQTITIPDQITSIGDGAFCATDLTEVIFEEGSALETIGENAFYECKDLQTITIPRSVKTIGSKAFCDCGKLSNVNLHEFNEEDQIPIIGSECFDGSNQYCCFVTSSELAATNFKTAEGWSNYSGRIFYGASVFYENKSTNPNMEFFPKYGGSLSDIVVYPGHDAVFHVEDSDTGSPADFNRLQFICNDGGNVSVTTSSGSFTINNSNYRDALTWIKVIYQ